MCIVQLSLPYRPVMLSLPYWPGLLYRPVLLLAQPSPVPNCSAARLPAHSSFLAVQAWTGGEEPYSQDLLYRPVLPLAYPPPYRPALQPFCRPALLSLPYRPGLTVRSPTARHALFSLPIPMAWPYLPSIPPPPQVERKSARFRNIRIWHLTTTT
jgi:hypothetical protein